MSVAQNVAFRCACAASPAERERRVSEALARVGLDGFAERKPSAFPAVSSSGGAGAGDRRARGAAV
jgi:ABC-type sulfate/molybdate transport systems ATPase subunit